jgi:hypothetical protein
MTTPIKFAIEVPVTKRNLTLNFDWDLIASADIGVQPCSKHFCQHPHRSAAAMHPTHKTRMHISHRKRQNVVHEFLMNFSEGRGGERN